MSAGCDDDSDPVIRDRVDRNLRDRVVPLVVASATGRDALSHQLACRWHREMLAGVAVRPPAAAGSVRHPSWCHGEVAIMGITGAPTRDVPAQVAAFDATFAARVQDLDARVAPGDAPADTATVEAVLLLAAELHGEWIRIHPFVNGNGRTARLWANWALIRYGLPPLLNPRPRPQLGQTATPGGVMTRYDYASFQSMTGYHRVMYALLKGQYRAAGPI